MTPKQNNLLKKIFLVMIFSFIAAGYSHAQSFKSNSGTDFYVAFGKNNQETAIAATGNPNVELILRIATQDSTQVTLTFTDGTVPPVIFTLPADTVFDYILSQKQAIAAYTGVSQSNPAAAGANKKSIRITATNPIELVAVNSANRSFEATLVWPVENWGTEYYNIGVDPYTTGTNCDGYIVIAKENNTIVSGITGIGNPGNINAITGPITLNAGEVYSYNNTGNNKDKLGEYIESDKPVAFFNSNSQGTITTTGSPQNNYTFEQLAPVNQWGKEFILPTNKYSAGLFRIYAKDASTVLNFTYSNGTSGTTTIAGPGYYDIRIDGNTNATAKACYLTASSPVGVCAFQIPNRTNQTPPQIGAPASAWLPPVQQMTRYALMSPLDLAGQYSYSPMNHFLTVIVHSSGKNSTTIALNGKAPQPVESVPNFTWVADNIGGSDYSFGSFKIDSTYVGTGLKAKNKTVLVDNPDGLIALAYSSEGSFATYFYAVGLNYKDLTAGFTVNDVDYIDMEGKGICDVSTFTFEAYPDTMTNVVWNINGTPAGTGISITNDLPNGYNVIQMIANDKTYTTSFFVGGLPVVWTPYTTTDDERYNWNNRANWTPAVVPTSCNNVFIPGNLDYYPDLSSNAACNNIYFMQGGKLGRPDLLSYKKAHIQYNFGLKENPQTTSNNNMSLVLNETSTFDRMLYSASVSTPPIERERWHMLSEPLRDVVTGDLGFGGFPLTFLMKFGPVNKDKKDYPVGEWTTPYTTMVEPVATNITDGFAFYMYGYGNEYNDNTGCEETGYFGQLNELNFLPATWSGIDFGLAKTDGILELPFFADTTSLYAHRTHVYDGQKSTFYYINDENKLTGRSESVIRGANNENYRFAPETYDSNNDKWIFNNPVQHTVTGLGDNDEFLVGNPYMSAIDMVAFLNENSASVYPSFRIWNGDDLDFITCTLDAGAITSTDGSDMSYIVPLQGFFLKYKGDGAVNFNVENTAVRKTTSSNLRSSQGSGEKNRMRIKAENDYSASYAIIGYKEGASNGYIPGEDVQKLFSPVNYVPSVYSLADEIPVDINFINDNSNIIIPLGIKTEQTGEIRLSFTGMDNYLKASKIELIDALENKTIDLTGEPSYTYSFNNTETGIQNGRFSLHISNSITSLPDVDSDNLNVYGNSKGIYVVSSEPVQQLEVYDFTGRKLYESASDARYYPLQGNPVNFPLVVKVMTASKVKMVKIN